MAILVLILVLLAMATATALVVPWVMIGTIPPVAPRPVADRLDELIEWARAPGPDWAEIEAYLDSKIMLAIAA